MKSPEVGLHIEEDLPEDQSNAPMSPKDTDSHPKHTTRLPKGFESYAESQEDIIRNRLTVQQKRVQYQRARSAVSDADSKFMDKLRLLEVNGLLPGELKPLYQECKLVRDEVGPLEREYDELEVSLTREEFAASNKFEELLDNISVEAADRSVDGGERLKPQEEYHFEDFPRFEIKEGPLLSTLADSLYSPSVISEDLELIDLKDDAVNILAELEIANPAEQPEEIDLAQLDEYLHTFLDSTSSIFKQINDTDTYDNRVLRWMLKELLTYWDIYQVTRNGLTERDVGNSTLLPLAVRWIDYGANEQHGLIRHTVGQFVTKNDSERAVLSESNPEPSTIFVRRQPHNFNPQPKGWVAEAQQNPELQESGSQASLDVQSTAQERSQNWNSDNYQNWRDDPVADETQDFLLDLSDPRNETQDLLLDFSASRNDSALDLTLSFKRQDLFRRQLNIHHSWQSTENPSWQPRSSYD